MDPIGSSADITSEEIKNYPGLTSCLLYGDWDRSFREFITDDENWNSMHEFSGKELLIVVPEKIQETKRVYTPRQEGEIINFMTPLSIGISHFRDSVVIELSEKFGIDFSEMPCILLFSDPDENEAVCIALKEGDYLSSLKDLFSISKKCVRNSEHFSVARSSEELVSARKEAIIRIIPEIRRRKFIKSIRKITLSDTIRIITFGGKCI